MSGEKYIGRRYFVKAVEYRLKQKNREIKVVEINLDGYEPEKGADTFIVHRLIRQCEPVSRFLKTQMWFETKLPMPHLFSMDRA